MTTFAQGNLTPPDTSALSIVPTELGPVTISWTLNNTNYLLAIQELNQKVEHRCQKAEGRIQRREAENAELKARQERLEQLVAGQFAVGQ